MSTMPAPTPAVPAQEGRTLEHQSELPRLPIPPLEETCDRYLRALKGLQDPKEHEQTKLAVEEFLKGEGPAIQEKLRHYAEDKARWDLLHLFVRLVLNVYITQLYRRILVRSLNADCRRNERSPSI
jgi:hypothetical protein